MLRNLLRNWDGALVLFTAFVSFFGPAWAVSELGMSAGWATLVVVLVFTTATVTVCIALHLMHKRRQARARARREALRNAALLAHRETLAGR